MRINRRDVVFLTLGLLPSLAVAAAALLFVPSSIAVYAPVAAQLPPQTRFVFSTYYLCLLLPVVVLCIWYGWRNPLQRGPLTAATGIFGSAAVFAFGWWCVYQPALILQLIQRSHQ